MLIESIVQKNFVPSSTASSTQQQERAMEMLPDRLALGLKVIAALIELFSQPGKWTQKYNARNSRNNSVPPNDPAACKWCLWGGMLTVAGPLGGSDAEDAAAKILRFHNSRFVTWNDERGRTQQEVVEWLKEVHAAHATQ